MTQKQTIHFNRYYDLQVSSDEVQQGRHRSFVGGMWDQVGKLQFDFLLQQGLLPRHTLLDVGCGCLRGGVHFINYLDKDRYFGLDINAGLLQAASYEIENNNLSDKSPVLLQDNAFEFGRFDRKFDFVLAISVFTHLPFNVISRCLSNIAECLKEKGVFFASFFLASQNAYLESITHDGGVVTQYDSDPFHASFEEYQWLAGNAGLQVECLGDWRHPRSQQMLRFTLG